MRKNPPTALTVLLALVLALAACGGTDGTATEPDPTPTPVVNEAAIEDALEVLAQPTVTYIDDLAGTEEIHQFRDEKRAGYLAALPDELLAAPAGTDQERWDDLLGTLALVDTYRDVNDGLGEALAATAILCGPAPCQDVVFALESRLMSDPFLLSDQARNVLDSIESINALGDQ